jgi:DNA-binding NtrC family response regulator
MEAVGSAHPMTSSNAPDPPVSSELLGVRILVVEDSWTVANSLKRFLLLLGADVAGPAATIAEAERLIAEHTPDVALVDIHLRGGERAYGLIDRLHDKGIPVIVTTGYAVVPSASGKVVAILEKPISMALLLDTLRPVITKTAAR